MKDYIVTVETVLRRELEVSAENESMAIDAVLAIAEQADDPCDIVDDFYANRFSLREVSEPESANREVFTICQMTDEEAEEAAAEKRLVCDKNCEDCPFEDYCEDVADELDDYDDLDDFDDLEDEADVPEDRVSCADILDYFNFISLQLENLTSLLEKVCKAIPKEER